MRFAPTTEHLDLQQGLRSLLAKECPPDVVRAIGAAPGGPAAQRLRDQLGEAGVWSLLVAPERDGLGLDETFLVPVMVELGRAAVPLPVVETVAYAPSILARLDPAVGMGRLVAADPSGAGVAAVALADLALVGGRGGRGPVEVLDLGSDVAARHLVAGVHPPLGWGSLPVTTRLGFVEDARSVDIAWHRAVVASAAALVGLSRRMLDMTVHYVAERHQFGVPVGSFQAVKHHLANALVAVEFAEPMVWSAAALLRDGGPDAGSEVSAAKALASDAADLVSRLAIQCHGAIGYTTEYDLHLYAKHAWSLTRAWGSAEWHRRSVAGMLLQPGVRGARGSGGSSTPTSP